MATATALPSILLILALAFTVATTVVANHPSPPSTEAIVMKKCREVLGPRRLIVTFCAHNLLGHRAALLATCERRKTVAVVIKEVHNKAKAFEALEKKINSDKSLSIKDAQDLKSCWAITNKVVSSLANVFINSSVEEPSKESIMMLKRSIPGEIAKTKEKCDSTAPGRQNGLWLELRIKELESITADIVASAFVNNLYSTTH
ncbi:uncharacterized protein LOC116029632 isoform X2 [Ipomoea triloba]|uniref:uncharacterized protein LOC116029632 isoform X1 n=1 Tax=Ipomoea triloba TaxID=35885 RepID=UPI00125E3962|nr:uncharacterized protein LOC116029632 isoform X1 [Ipomoea triloba]XP_031127547.1 uncharacterized protein LOC116029632 isoform X2 [Ipomoea triloba]